MSAREHIEYEFYGVWVSGKRGHWLPDPLQPLTTYHTTDRKAAETLLRALPRSKTETYIVCGIRENEF